MWGPRVILIREEEVEAVMGNTRARIHCDRELLRWSKDAILRLAPGARVILYGSYARGTQAPGSDVDLLVLLPSAPSTEVTDRIRDTLYEIELEHNAVISVLFYSEEDWRSPLRRAAPFHQEVERQGIVL